MAAASRFGAKSLNGHALGVILSIVFLIQLIQGFFLGAIWLKQESRDGTVQLAQDLLPELRILVSNLHDQQLSLGDLGTMRTIDERNTERIDALEQVIVKMSAQK